MDTYKLYEFSLGHTIEEIKDMLVNNQTLYYDKVIFNDERVPIDKIPLERGVIGPNIVKDMLFSRFRFEKLSWGYDANNVEKPYKLRFESEICVFPQGGNKYLFQYPTGKGRSEIRWYFRHACDAKKTVVKSITFPETLIETLKSKYGWVPYVEEIPQHEPHASRVRWIGRGVDKDPIAKLTRQRGSPVDQGILHIASNGWQIQVNKSGSIKCYQDPYHETFINFLRKLVLPLI